MKSHRSGSAGPFRAGLLAACCLLLVMVFPLYGEQFSEEVSTQDYLFFKGMVRSVSEEDLTITAKERKGPTLTFSVAEDTILEGFYKLSDLKPRQTIKIWYRPIDQQNRALKIVKPPDMGC